MASGLLRLQVVEVQTPGPVGAGRGGHDAAAGKAVSQQAREQERCEMVQREGLLQALRSHLARRESCPRVIGKDVNVLVAPADLVGQHPDV